MKPENVFPFYLDHSEGHRQFQCYFRANKDEIIEKHGHMVYTGRGSERSWSYYEVDATIIDDVTMEFQTYDMRDSYSGGRGDAQEKFTHKFDTPKALKKFVDAHKRIIAEQVLDQREDEAAARKREDDIDAVYNELFAA